VALTAVAPAIIYLNGVSSAGKSTLARVLVRAMEDPYCLVAMDEFAGMASRRFPLPDTQGLSPDV
jgi:chloramphenicol 3-O-phosphotransferase